MDKDDILTQESVSRKVSSTIEYIIILRRMRVRLEATHPSIRNEGALEAVREKLVEHEWFINAYYGTWTRNFDIDDFIEQEMKKRARDVQV